MAELYKTLVEPNHPNCKLVEQALQDCIAKARKLFGPAVMGRLDHVMVEFYDKGKCAGIATIGKHKDTGLQTGLIQFSMRLTVKRSVAMIKQIVPHELAHIICMTNKWDMGHGRIWRQVCMMLGGNGQTHHTMEVIDGRLKNVYEAKCDEGHTYWLTGPQKRVAASRGLQALTESGVEIMLTKKSLTGIMKPL